MKKDDRQDLLWARMHALLDRLEAFLPAPAPAPDWRAIAYRWQTQGGRGWLVPVHVPHLIRLSDLKGIEAQKTAIDRNTRQFVAKLPANNVLLTGARGTGKSSLVKAMLHKYARRGLRLIEVDKSDLVHLAEIVALIAGRSERFIIFCDDLSFEASEVGYKALKSVLDGSIAGAPENVLIYATSNRRHLMPERMSENLEALRGEDGEIHPGEASEEKVSLSERFGLWLSFYPFDQEHYLEICRHWLNVLGVPEELAQAAHREALQWAMARGARNGRVAWQFARDYAGRLGLRKR
ncbi:MAG: ATP-binding protein [Rhodocyclaceae bacterium]|nr:ATP-binding protein [Rhodocyclaceae bacterium]